MRPYRYRHVVTLDETNVVGNVYFAHYVHWQGHCRERFLADHAPEVLAAVQAGALALVTASCAMEYYAECFGLDVVDVDMFLEHRSRHRIGMTFVFRRGDVEVARGRQEVACMVRGPSGVVPTPVPDQLVAALRDFS